MTEHDERSIADELLLDIVKFEKIYYRYLLNTRIARQPIYPVIRKNGNSYFQQ